MMRSPLPTLMLITDRHRVKEDLVEIIAGAVAGGVDAVQIREPDLTTDERHSLASRIVAATRNRAQVVMNSDIATARSLGIGLHLPENAQASAEARRRIGDGPLLGRSVHSPAVARAADDVDYILAGHVFATFSKPGMPPIKTTGLRAIVEASWSPVIAIGGITPERVKDVMNAGAIGVAVITAILDAPDPRAAATALRLAVDAARTSEEGMEVASTDTFNIIVNGRDVEVGLDSTVEDYLIERGLTNRMAVVERNGLVLARREYSTTFLQPNDRLEIVHAVGGG